MNIHIILGFILWATLFNLFYKTHVFANAFGDSSATPITENPFEFFGEEGGRKEGGTRGRGDIPRNRCETGFECPNAGCDCSKLCPDHPRVRKVTVSDRHPGDGGGRPNPLRTEGAYCLPDDRPSFSDAYPPLPPFPNGTTTECDPKSSTSVFSHSEGPGFCRRKPYWNEDGRCFLCKNANARNNDWNNLIDVRTEEETGLKTIAPWNADLFETFLDSRNRQVPRYRCECASLDLRGNKMVTVASFRCESDYCMKNFVNKPMLGWNGQHCDCGPFPHRRPDRLTSPCVHDASRWDTSEDVFHGVVPCTHAETYVHAFDVHPVFCPSGKRNVVFDKYVHRSSDPQDFLKRHKDKFPDVTVLDV